MRFCTGNHRRCRAAAAAVAGCLLVVVAQLAVAAGPGVHGRVLELDTEGKITGTVTGAAIEYQNQSGAAAGRATSGEGGYYRVDLPPGKYYYKVTAPGYKDEDHGRGVALQRSEGYAVYNLSLTKGQNDPDWKPPVIDPVELGELSGRVWGAGPERGAARIGVPWAEISLRRTDGDRELVRVASGDKDPKAGREAGQYAIALSAGTWQASVSAKGFQTLVDPQPIVIDPAKPAVRDFLLTRLVPDPVRDQGIKGLITIDNPELSPQAKSSVLSRVEVYIQRLWSAEARLVNPIPLDAKGSYSRDLPEGKYRVMAFAKEYKTARSGPVDVFVGKYSVVNLTLVPEVKPEPEPEPTPEPEPKPEPTPPVERLVFQGTVYEQTAGTEARRPLPGASVLIRMGNQAMSEAPRGTTDSQGQVKLEVAAAGEYTVLAQKSGYEPGGARVTIAAGAANSQAVTLSRESTPPEPVPPKKTVAVTGYVVYRDAASRTGYRGVKGAQVIWIRPGSRNLPAVADIIGKFSLELLEGTYRVNVEPPAGFTGASEDVVVRGGMKPKYFILERREETRPEPQPEQLVRVQGYVMTQSPTTRGYVGVAGAKIIWAGGPRRPLPTVTSDRSGRFAINLPEAGYDVAVEAPPGYKNTSKGVIVQRGMKSVSFVLEREGRRPPGPVPQPPVPDGLATLNVRVLIAGVPVFPPPLPGAEVLILQSNRKVASGRADLLGNASFRLKPGSYEIQARMQGYESSRGMVMLRAGANSQNIFLKRTAGPEPGPQPQGQVVFTLRVVGMAPAMPGAPTRRSPLAGARINIMQNRRSVLTGQTNQAGIYSGRLPSGNYQVSVSRQGFNPNQVALNLAGRPVSLEIVLRKGEYPETPDRVPETPMLPGRLPGTLPGRLPGTPTLPLPIRPGIRILE